MTEAEEIRELEAERTRLREEYDRYDSLFWQYPSLSFEAEECEKHCSKLADRIDRLSDQIAQLNYERREQESGRWLLAVARRELPL